MIYSNFEINLKQAVVSCLTNAIAPLLIVLENCSNPQADRLVCTQRNFSLGIADFLGVTS